MKSYVIERMENYVNRITKELDFYWIELFRSDDKEVTEIQYNNFKRKYENNLVRLVEIIKEG
jgi:hypothetical protein